MPNYSLWRGVSCSLPRSKKWRRTSDEGRALWLGLMLASDTYGCMEADADQLTLTAVVGWDEDKVERALAHLVDVGLVALYEAEGRTWLQLTDYDEHAPAELLRKRGKRRTPSSGTPPKGGHRPVQSKSKRESKSEPIATNVACATAVPAGSTGEQVPSDVLQVYEGWKEAQKATGGAVPRKLTPDRRTRIAARLKEGYTPSDLLVAIRAYMADPFHLGQNTNGTRYTDITTLLKNAGKVDAGLQLAQKQAGSSVATDAARSRYVRPS